MHYLQNKQQKSRLCKQIHFVLIATLPFWVRQAQVHLCSGMASTPHAPRAPPCSTEHLHERVGLANSFTDDISLIHWALSNFFWIEKLELLDQ